MSRNRPMIQFVLLILLTAFVWDIPTFAEDYDYLEDPSYDSSYDTPTDEPSYEPQTRKRRKKRRRRKRKTRRPSNAVTEEIERPSGRSNIRLSVHSGYAQVGSPNALVQTALTAGELSKSIVAGLDFFALFSSNFGVDFEGFYGFNLSGSRTGDLGGVVNSNLSPFGVVLGAFGRLPFQSQTTTIAPYLGVSAGGFALNFSRDANGSSTSGIGGSYGVGALVGLSLEVQNSVGLFVDYSIPVLMYGQGQLGSLVFSDTSWDRFRASVEFPVGRSISLGAQYILRNFRFRTALNNLSATTLLSSNQFMAFIEFQL